MTYTQIKIKAEYREKLKRLADSQNRSMANMVEVLIDQADTKVSTGVNSTASSQDEPTQATSREQPNI